MDGQERIKLMKMYREMPEEQVIEILLEDEEIYKKEPYESYELLMQEAENRGIEEKINELKTKRQKQKEEQKQREEAGLQEGKRWVSVYVFFDEVDKGYLEGLFEQNKIPFRITSRLGAAYKSAFKSSQGLGELTVREDYVEEAQRIISDFERDIKNK